MKRALLPVIMTGLGLVLIVWASTMPLFDWQVALINADYPPTYKVHLVPSPWTTRLGESFDDDFNISRRVIISIEKKNCWIGEGRNIIIERSKNDDRLEFWSSKFKNVVLWLALGSLILIALSGVYMWWIIIWREHRTIIEAVASTSIIVFIYYLLILMRELLGSKISVDYFFSMCLDHQGTVTLSAEISKVHYEVLIVLVSAILLELGALGKMLHEIKGTATRR